MKSGKNVLEFEVLGFKVKFKPEGEDQSVSASEVVECVNNEANNLKQLNSSIEQDSFKHNINVSSLLPKNNSSAFE